MTNPFLESEKCCVEADNHTARLSGHGSNTLPATNPWSSFQLWSDAHRQAWGAWKTLRELDGAGSWFLRGALEMVESQGYFLGMWIHEGWVCSSQLSRVQIVGKRWFS